MIFVPPSPPRRIAIVGTGIAGLVCAHRLHDRHDLALFESGDHVGGHTNTVDVHRHGRRLAVDTGFIVYNERNYPEFTALLGRLGVASQPTGMSFSVRCDRTGLEYNGSSLNRLFAQRRNLLQPRFHRMLSDILRFGREAPEALRMPDEAATVEDYARSRGYGPEFIEQYLVPLGSSIWSCPPGSFRTFPVRFVVEFLQNHGMLALSGRPQWRVIRGGSRRYVDAMIKPFRERIRLRTPVRSLRRGPDGVTLVTGRGDVERFDDVIVACHADQALRLLDDPSPQERTLLSAFPYQRNDAVLHTDTTLLPRRRRAWAAWNYHIRADERDAVTVTYNMNILQGLDAPDTYCVTLNAHADIEPSRIIDRFTYEHPLYTWRREQAQARHGEVIDVNRTSFCGAYWGYGFHEDGVRSALAVCRALERVAVP